MKEHEARINREKERGAKTLINAQSGAGKLEGLILTLTAKVGGGTKLYGSITAQDVAEAIAKERGVTVDKRRVGLLAPIKTLGTYTIPVRLHSDVSIPVTVEVMTEEQIEKRKQAQAAAAAAAAANPPVEETAPPAEAAAAPTAEAEAAPAPEASAEPAAAAEDSAPAEAEAAPEERAQDSEESAPEPADETPASE
jgi:large subunit ribosomal protein L9